MLEGTRGHRYIVIKQNQMEGLHCLVDAANALFKRVQVISVIDLVYAALWRQLSAVRGGAKELTLTVVEVAGDVALAGRGVLADSPYPTFSSTFDCLTSQPLVGVAQKIRCRLEEGVGDAGYEGWLVDSLAGAGNIVESTRHSGLICSSLPLAYLHELLLHSASSLLRQGARRVGLTGDAVVAGNLSAPRKTCSGMENDSGVSIDASQWICCINLSRRNRGNDEARKRLPESELRREDFSGEYVGSSGIPGSGPVAESWAGSRGQDKSTWGESHDIDMRLRPSEIVSHELISIDMWGPLMEVGHFDFMYGDCCFVSDDFFGN